jgi:hypothetical protein
VFDSRPAKGRSRPSSRPTPPGAIGIDGRKRLQTEVNDGKRCELLDDARRLNGQMWTTPSHALKEIAMLIKSNPTPAFASAAAQSMQRRSAATLLSVYVLGLASLAPTGAWACGQLPPGVEATGPVLRSGADSHPVQPVLIPHCSLTAKPNGAVAGTSAQKSNQPEAEAPGPARRAD